MFRALKTSFLILSLLASVTAQAEADVKNGEKIYKKCYFCHTLDQPTNRMGPHLMDLQGRKAGSVEGFRYSEAMKQAGENGLIWNDATLKEFLTSPKTMMPGTSMRFWGLWESQIDDLFAYLKSRSEAAPGE
ncbi:cytochrome c family protein [Bacillus subtilis]|uniref:c-type cytochrome n=1 Tax=Pseudochrobactrum asaccharolyticum TaxID=354351 RepID=UPI001F400560|nr:cytochrome c family protein [Pseudochrobactrum asaccharolyticum]MCF7645123.1 cytochrome c family protein [Pseudochrobactrum asaccharolyticum]MCF7671446.1 cytochrome c family protein [Bacillus subtilis]